jgi:hypothetical protein
VCVFGFFPLGEEREKNVSFEFVRSSLSPFSFSVSFSLSLSLSQVQSRSSHLAVAGLHRDHPLRAIGPVHAHAVALDDATEEVDAAADRLDAGPDLGIRLPLVVPGLFFVVVVIGLFCLSCVSRKKEEESSRSRGGGREGERVRF